MRGSRYQRSSRGPRLAAWSRGSATVAVLAAVLLASLPCDAHKEERLIGWLGEKRTLPRKSKAGSGAGSGPAPVAQVVQGSIGGLCTDVGDGAVDQGGDNRGPLAPSQWIYQYPPDNHEGSEAKPGYTHMAMVQQLPNGTLVMAWQAARTREGDSDQHIVLASSLDPQGTRWAPSFKLQAVGGMGGAVWGPVLHADEEAGKLFLFFSESRGTCPGGPMEWAPGGDVRVVEMSLGTGEWGTPRTILSQDTDHGIPKVTANKVAVLSTGEWLLPFWRERALLAKGRKCAHMKGSGGAGVLLSTDRGLTWQPHGNLVRKETWLIENAIAEAAPGETLMVFRSRANYIYESRSFDGGRTWGEAKPTKLPNPNAKIDLVRLQPRGELALVFNDHMAPKVPGWVVEHGCKKCRTLLRVALSKDKGKTWERIATLEHEVGASLRMHYPTLQQVGCKLLVAYSRFYSKHLPEDDIKHDQQGIKLAWVALNGREGGGEGEHSQELL